MAAYSAVISLLQTLEKRNIPELFHGHEVVDSIRATANDFLEVLENVSNTSGVDPEKIKSLEEKIRVAASYAEDAVELKISQIVNEISWTFGIFQHQDLLTVVENMDTTKKQVMEIWELLKQDGELKQEADQILEFSEESSIDKSSRSHGNLEGDAIVQGRDDELDRIIKRLTGPPSHLDVVTISGMGGIGKTTLARKAYDLAIRYHFDIHAWVTISQEFRRRDVYIEALRCISKTQIDYDKKRDSDLADLVRKNLKHGRYLFVVDDIWSSDVWDSISGIFPDDKNGSRILLTTRETEVAMHASTGSHHEMDLLTLEDGWNLLCHKVFGPKHDQFPELEEIGKEIVGKCQGLPLTISVIAGHLSKMARTLEVWKYVSRTLNNIIASHPDKCLGVLGLSYHHLPNHLKPCFLSMSSFPEDFQVETWRLIQLWIAEGFIRTSENGKSLEEVAIDCLEDLISRNLIQARKRRFSGEVKSCGIHDLLREFCLKEAEMTKFMHVGKTYHTLPTQKHDVCRFSFQARVYSSTNLFNLLPPVSKSIYFFSGFYLPWLPRIKLLGILPIYRSNPVIQNYFSRFNRLRVLAIFNRVQSSFPLVITKLSHLRYLQFQFDGDINIPESISELQHLQTLICSGNYGSVVTLPRKIWMMKNLRCINLGKTTYLPSPRRESILNKHLGMPNLEELSSLCYTSCTNEVLSGITNLKRMIIRVPSVFDNDPSERIDISFLKKLEAFKCYYGGDSWQLGITIRSWVFPTSLKRLTLVQCWYFPWKDLSSTVIMLPNLEEFKLKDCSYGGDTWRLREKDKFERLKLLLLDVAQLKRWEIPSSDNFPKLERLVLKNCKVLEEIPTELGEVDTLKSIELHDCGPCAEDSARNIAQEQEYMGNNPVKVYIHHSRRK